MDPELATTPFKYPTFVTHAHSDHTAAISGSSLTYLTKITKDLYDVTSPRTARNYKYIEENQTLEIGNLQIEFLKAGHLLGAVQILIRDGKESFLYTGDFCPEDLLTVEGAVLPKEEMDLTIIDSTYGDSFIFFETRTNSRQNLFYWIMQQLNENKIPVVNVGQIGGSQELIKFINQLTTSKLPILVNSKVKQICKIYEENGINLDYYDLDDPKNSSLLESKCIILVPRSYKDLTELLEDNLLLKEKMVRCIVTGQSAKYGFYSFDYTSSLSTHAHYNELIEVTKVLNPKHVLTHYGHHEKFATSLVNDHNVSAESFSKSKPVNIKELKSRKTKPKRKLTKKEKAFGFTPLDYFLQD